MSTELLIALQFIMILVIAVIMLLLILLRQKNTINQLKQILTDVKDDISGNNLTGYLQLEIDDTTAHCKQETIVLKPDLAPEDMAISLRYLVLQAELALIQDHVGSENTPWREKIKNYVLLSEKVTDIIKQRIDHATKTLNESHNKEIAEKDENITALEELKQEHQKRLADLKPLQEFIDISGQDDISRNELEQSLHKALLSICENFSNTESFRELVFLIHEAYNEGQTSSSGDPKSDSANTLNQNMDILNNIIDHQKTVIRKLKDKVSTLKIDDSDLHNAFSELEKDIEQTSLQLEAISAEPASAFQATSEISKDVSEILEQFIEESAVMVEKIHTLSNQNKLLEKEKKALEESISQSASGGDASDDSLKLLLDEKDKELLSLQKSLTELEEKYLTLYQSQSDSGVN